MSDDLFQRLMHHPSLWERLTRLLTYLLDGRDAEVATKLDAADRIAALEAELREAREAAEAGAAFVVVWADGWARERGWPEGQLHPEHYDLAARMGANLQRFTRANL